MNDKNIIQFFENILKDNPKSLVFARLASLYLEQGRIDDAISLLEQGIQTYPSYVTGHFVLAKAYIAKNMREKAEEALKKVISHDRLYLHAHKLLGDLMARIGWENKAAIHYRDILEIDPLDEETAQMLDTFSFAVKPPEGNKIPTSTKEKEWISGTPPIFERSEKVSKKKQELDQEADKTSSPETSELDLSGFDIDKFAASGKSTKNHSAQNKPDESYTGELDLSDFDLENISPDSGKDTENPEFEKTIIEEEQLLGENSDTESTSGITDKSEMLLPNDESEPAAKDMTEPVNSSDSDLQEIVNDINQAINQKPENEHLKDILLPDEDEDVKSEETQKPVNEFSEEDSDNPFFEEGLLSNITGTTDQEIPNEAKEANETNPEEGGNDFFADEESVESHISDQLFKDEDTDDSADESTVADKDEKPKIKDSDSNEKLPAEDIVSQIQEDPLPDVEKKETTEINVEKKESEAAPESSEKITDEVNQESVEQPGTEESNNSASEEPEETDKKNSLKIVSPTLGEIYSAQGQFKKAIQVYETLIEKYPDDTGKYTQKINELKKKLEEAS